MVSRRLAYYAARLGSGRTGPPGFASAEPPLKFELIDVYAGVNTVAIHYRSVGRKYVVEVIEFDPHGRPIRGSACQGVDVGA